MANRRVLPGSIDLLDGMAGVSIVLLSAFLLSFFSQVGAGAARTERAYLDKYRLESEKRIAREQAQIASIREKVAAGTDAEAWEEGLELARHLEGNSQLHLFLARGYERRNLLEPAIVEYRKAVELNHDYTDEKSPYFVGEDLRPLVQKARRAFVGEGRRRANSDGRREIVQDIFYLQRSLAGGCR